MLHGSMDKETRLRRLRFRASHRGTREADLMVGGFFDRHSAGWDEREIEWFEALIEEQDVDIMGWAMDRQPVPERLEGEMMNRLKALDYIMIAK
jgi:antitoxin CptB